MNLKSTFTYFKKKKKIIMSYKTSLDFFFPSVSLKKLMSHLLKEKRKKKTLKSTLIIRHI